MFNNNTITLNNVCIANELKNICSAEYNYEANNMNGNHEYIVTLDKSVTLEKMGSDHGNDYREYYFRLKREGFIDRILVVHETMWQGGSESLSLVPLK